MTRAGCRLRGGKRTLWGALIRQEAVFRIAPDRHRREAQALLGEDFSGIACSERWWAYDYLDPERRQLCWAHLVRDLTAHSEGLGAQTQFGAAGLLVAEQMFEAWGEFREDGDRGRLLEHLAPLQEELRALLEEAARKSARNRRHRTFARNLLKRWPALWTFAGVPGVEPTNNHAERGLRGAVIYRKLSLGSQSEEGERTIARLLSASVTCRLQRRSLFSCLSDVLAAKIRGDPSRCSAEHGNGELNVYQNAPACRSFQTAAERKPTRRFTSVATQPKPPTPKEPSPTRPCRALAVSWPPHHSP